MTGVFFATNRDPVDSKDFGKTFSKAGLVDLRFGYADVYLDKNRKLGDLGEFRVAPDMSEDENGRPLLGSKATFDFLRKKMADKHRSTVVFIHGYNVDFHEALASGAWLRENLDPDRFNVIVFSWPSDGSMMPFKAYWSDRADARASGVAVARGFLKLSDYLKELTKEDLCDHSVHLIAHSMGNYVLRNAVQEMRDHVNKALPRVFDQILLCAADEDDDAFEHEHKLRLLPRLGQRVTCYFNARDLAMTVSDVTKNNPDRLGSDGPRLPQQVPAKVNLVDCTRAVERTKSWMDFGEGIVQHGYFLSVGEVVEDMRAVLAGTPSQEIERRVFRPETNRFEILAG